MRDKDLRGVDLPDGDTLEQLGVRIASSTIARVKHQAKRHRLTISGAVDILLRDALLQEEGGEAFQGDPK